MNKKIKISDLCSHLDEHFYEDMDVQNMTGLNPSEDRIKKLVFQKLKDESADFGSPSSNKSKNISKNKTTRLSKKAGHLLLIAAIVCLFATTVFAAAGGFDYFRSVFGDSTENVKDSISFPMNQTGNGEYQISLESMLTDGYKINLIMSLENVKGKALDQKALENELELFQTSLTPPSSVIPGNDEPSMSYTCSQLPDFGTKSKKFYHIQIDALANCLNYNLNISLNDELADLTIHSAIQGAAAAKEISINKVLDDQYTLATVQLSPLGVMVIGREVSPSGGLPTPQIDVKFKDGTIDEMMSATSFDSGDGETVTGGGGAVIGEDPMTGPLVISTYGRRNPDGKVVTTGDFGRIINLDDVASIIVNGMEYQF